MHVIAAVRFGLVVSAPLWLCLDMGRMAEHKQRLT